MPLLQNRVELANLLEKLEVELDIPAHVYEDATQKYEDIGEFLAEEGSSLRQYTPIVYPQGSFRLGTVVHPVSEQDEYDIDLVCRLTIPKENTTQAELKKRVGGRLREREDLSAILESMRRCWRLHFPVGRGEPGFHLDVLPTIPNVERAPNGVLLTDTALTRWQKSNPIAYAEWFKSRMAKIYAMRKAALAEATQTSVEDVPDWSVKTPLQRAVQVLKRHRDVHFFRDPERKPVSIVITTLAAHAYRGESESFDTLTGILDRMPSYVENRDGRWWVQNPVDSDENFADKWNEYPERRELFAAWLTKARSDFIDVGRAGSVQEGLVVLEKAVGEAPIRRVARSLGLERPGQLVPTVRIAPVVPALGDIRHVHKPSWPVTPTYAVRVKAGVYFKRGSKRGRYLYPLGAMVRRGLWIKFAAKTDTPPPYTVKWQVVNSGDEAVNAGQVRGDFYDSDAGEEFVRWESTSYRGTHWVEAFVIKNGYCVGRSGQVLVRIA